MLYSAGQFGVGLGFIPGFLFNQYGVKFSGLYSVLLIVFGAFFFTRNLARPSCGGNPSLMAFFYFCVGRCVRYTGLSHYITQR